MSTNRSGYRFLAFDIETGFFDPQKRLEDQLPGVGIICSAVAWRSINGQIIYHTWESALEEFVMTKEQCRRIVDDIQRMILDYKIDYVATVNGVGFDFPVLAAESGFVKEVSRLALDSVDLLYHAVCSQGHRIGLEALAIGNNVQGKLHDVVLSDGTVLTDMSGSMAPDLWKMGQREPVLAYLRNDVRVTLEVAEKTAAYNRLRWQMKNGRIRTVPIRLMNVRECRDNIPLPDQSWMTKNPKDIPNRIEMLKWTEQ